MSTIRDFAKSLLSDKLQPIFRDSLEDVVYEVLNDREIPDRTDFNRLRKSIQEAKSASISATNAVKALEKRVAAIEESLAKKAPAKRAPAKKSAKKAAARK